MTILNVTNTKVNKNKQNKGKKEETNHPICGYTICHINWGRVSKRKKNL